MSAASARPVQQIVAKVAASRRPELPGLSAPGLVCARQVNERYAGKRSLMLTGDYSAAMEEQAVPRAVVQHGQRRSGGADQRQLLVPPTFGPVAQLRDARHAEPVGVDVLTEDEAGFGSPQSVEHHRYKQGQLPGIAGGNEVAGHL